MKLLLPKNKNQIGKKKVKLSADEKALLITEATESSYTTDKFVDKFYSLGSKKRDGVSIKVGGTSAFVELIPFASRVHISEVSLPLSKQGLGLGHKVMKMLTDLADEMKVTLHLQAQPIDQGEGEEMISKAKLVEFYKKHGFNSVSQGMIREPK